VAQAAIGAPRFADACAFDLASHCQHVELGQLHDLAALGAVAKALGGRWDAAFARARGLLRANLDLMRTSRSALSAMVARQSVRRDLDLVRVLLDGVEGEAPSRLSALRDLADIASLLDAPAEPDMDGRRAVVSEYVYVTGAIRTVLQGARSSAGFPVHPLILDAQHTVVLANSYFHRLEEFARHPSTRQAPTLPRFSRNGFGWWAYNPAGKLLLDAAMLDHAPAILAMAEQKAEIGAASDRLRQRIRALLVRAAPRGQTAPTP